MSSVLAALLAIVLACSTVAPKKDAVNLAAQTAERMEAASITAEDIRCLAYQIEREAGGIPNEDEQTAVVWVVLNRVDDARFPDTIADVLHQPGQFRSSYGTASSQRFTELVIETLIVWLDEKATGELSDKRTLLPEYCWYSGNGTENFYRTSYEGNGSYWDWRWDN